MASNIDWRNEIAARAQTAGLDAPRRDDRGTGRAPRRDLRGRASQRIERGRGTARGARGARRITVRRAAAQAGARRPSSVADAVRGGAGHRAESESARRDSPRGASTPPASGIRRHHHPRPRARHRREHHGLHRRGLRAAAAASVRRSRSARDLVGFASAPRVAERTVVASDLHGLPLAAGVRRGGGMAPAQHQPRRSRSRSASCQYDRSQRQPVRCTGGAAADRRRLSSRRAVFHRRADDRHQRSPVADALPRRPLDCRPATPFERWALHGRRRDASALPLSR